MEILFIALGGLLLGSAAHVALPRRRNYGVAVLPAVGLVVASIAWVALSALGWPADGGWIWLVSLVLPAVASVVVGLVFGRARARSDAEFMLLAGIAD